MRRAQTHVRSRQTDSKPAIGPGDCALPQGAAIEGRGASVSAPSPDAAEETSADRGANFRVRSSLRLVTIAEASLASPSATHQCLDRIARGPLAERLCVSHWHRFPSRRNEIEDAYQEALDRALTKCDAVDEAAVYSWLWRAMNTILLDRGKKAKWELPSAPDAPSLMLVPDEHADPLDVLDAAERSVELHELFDSVSATLAPRQRSVLALYARGTRRARLAEELGLSQRLVKRELETIVSRARESLLERCAAGCGDGTAVVCRFAFGIATTHQAAQAQLHLLSCSECQALLDRLSWWKEAAAAVVPVPAAHKVDPSIPDRVVHKLSDAFLSVQEQLAHNGSAARHHGLDAALQVKHHAVTLPSRVADWTPVAGSRPRGIATVCACAALYAAPAAVSVQTTIDPIERHAPVPVEQAVTPPPVEVEQPASSPPPPDLSQLPTPTPAPTTGTPAVDPAPTTSTTTAAPPLPAPPPEEQEFDPAAAAEAAMDPAPSQPAATPAPQQSPAPPSNPAVGEFLGGP